MRPVVRLAPSGLQHGGPVLSASQALISLPLLLAAFALLLQLSNMQTKQTSVYLINGGRLSTEPESYLPHRPRVLIEPAGGQAVAGASRSGGSRLTAAGTKQRVATQLGAPERGLGTDWVPQGPDPEGPKIAFVVTTSESLAQIKVWLAYHRAVGVTRFYLFVDGQAARPDVMGELKQLEGVRVIPRDDQLKALHARSRIWNETWLSAFFNKPCNHELFVTQSLNMEIAIKMARQDRMDWLLHIDTDELVFPSGSRGFSLQEVLGKVDPEVDTLIFPNYESLPERDDVVDPFTEVTLFKKNYQHVVSDLYFKNYHTMSRGNPNYFITYGNGKSAARVQRGLRPNGAHRWHSYIKTPNEQSSDQAAVLHYTYNRFGDLKSRRDRCDCAPTEEDAKRCFILPFDRMAFLEASLKSDAELMQWFRDRLVWSDPAVVTDLLKKGLVARLYEPQIMIRGFLAASQLPLQQAVAATALAEAVGAAGAADGDDAGEADPAAAAKGAGKGAAAGQGGNLDHEPIEQLAQDGEVGQVLPKAEEERLLEQQQQQEGGGESTEGDAGEGDAAAE